MLILQLEVVLRKIVAVQRGAAHHPSLVPYTVQCSRALNRALTMRRPLLPLLLLLLRGVSEGAQAMRSITELRSVCYHYEVVKRGINMSLDKKVSGGARRRCSYTR
jgi:hypothetical protein